MVILNCYLYNLIINKTLNTPFNYLLSVMSTSNNEPITHNTLAQAVGESLFTYYPQIITELKVHLVPTKIELELRVQLETLGSYAIIRNIFC